MTRGRDLWSTIAIVIVFYSLHKDFDTTIISLLKIDDKTINQIESILQSKNAKNISKQATKEAANNLAMTFRDKRPKKKVNSNNKCYNCHKLVKDCFFFDKRLNRTI